MRKPRRGPGRSPSPSGTDSRPAPRPATGGNGNGGAPAGNAAANGTAKPFAPNARTRALTLTAWDIARTRKQEPDTARGQIMTLRTYQKLLSEFEDERGINQVDRSYLRVREGAKGSCLLVHGVSTGPGDLRDLAEEFYEAGFNIYVLRLPDYGKPGHTLSEISWESALRQVRQSYQLLARGGGKVHLVGLGFGATLALHLASGESVSSLVLLAPAITPRENFLQRMAVRLKLHHFKFIHRWLGWNVDLLEGMERARGRIGKVQVPIFAAQCDDDDRACPSSLRFLQKKAKNRSSRFRVFPEGGHAILAAHGEAMLNEEVLGFCEAR
jgi:esterase/lipase